MKQMTLRTFFTLIAIALTIGSQAQAKSSKPAVRVATAPQIIAPIGNVNAPRGGTFYYNLGAEPASLNPIPIVDLYSDIFLNYTNDNLLTRNIDTYAWEPGLAETWEISPDGKTFTFHLRRDLKFSDGHALSAEDVKFSFDAIFDDAYNAASRRSYFELIEKAEVLDPVTVKFTAKSLYFGNFLQLAGLRIVPKHIYGDAKSGSKLNKSVIGSGPYKIEKYEQGQRITLIRNPLWWGYGISAMKGRNNFDKIVVRFVQEENISLEMVKKGELDFDSLSAEMFVKKAVGAEWGKTVEKVKTENKEPKQLSFVAWNLRNDLFKDREVRRALLMLMNRELMNEKFKFGMSFPAAGPWESTSDYASPKVKAVKFDPKKAVEMLAKAGWKDSDKDGVLDKLIDGKKVNFEFTVLHANKDTEKYLTLYQEDLKKVGIKMNIKLLEWNAFLKFLDDAKFDAVALAWGGGDVELDPKQIWHSTSAVKGGSNYGAYSNPEVDKLIDEGRVEMDRNKRITKFRKVFELVAADAPYAWMFTPRYALYAQTKKVARPQDTFGYEVGLSTWWPVQTQK